MSDRKSWLILASVTVLTAGGLGAAIYQENESITEVRASIAKLDKEIVGARKLVEKTPGIEKEVIVLRELSGVFEQILPSDKDANEMVQIFHRYSELSEVESTAFKANSSGRSRASKKSDFDKVGYTLTLAGDTFQFLDFLNRIETHSRFMAIPSFNLDASSRSEMETLGYARHKIQVDVETYVYKPGKAGERVSIEGYERKRDLLATDIAKRRQALTLSTFNYRGARGRRDPWIDPRVPVEENPSGLTVSEQNDKVDELVAMFNSATGSWDRVEDAENVLERMMEKRDLSALVVRIEDELRRVDAGGLISYTPAVKRLQNEVRDPLSILRRTIEESSNIRGPLREELIEVAGSMRRDVENGEFELALRSYSAVKNSLDLVQGDPVRVELALELRRLAEEADILREFESIEMSFGGQVLIEDRAPAVLINNQALSIGDMLRPGLEVIGIRPNEVDFAFRGVVLVRAF